MKDREVAIKYITKGVEFCRDTLGKYVSGEKPSELDLLILDIIGRILENNAKK